MPRIRITEDKLYKFEELSESAKETARSWWRNASSDDNYWSESVIEDFEETLKACGFDVDRTRGSHSQPAIYWEGFSHQGQGASFKASWRASDVNVTALIADRPLVWKDGQGVEHPSEGNARLVPILERMATLAQADSEAYGSTEPYSRSHSQRSEYDSDTEEEMTAEKAALALPEEFESLCDALANHLYRSLETEYDYQNANEQVDDTICANEYEFYEDGKKA